MTIRRCGKVSNRMLTPKIDAEDQTATPMAIPIDANAAVLAL